MSRYETAENSYFTRPLIIGLVAAVIVGVILVSQLDKPHGQKTSDLEIPKEKRLQKSTEATSERLPDEIHKQPSYTQDTRDGAATTERVAKTSILPLPPLAQSDALFREDVISISPKLAEWVQGRDLIKKYLLVFNDAAQGLRIFKHFNFLTLNEPFVVGEDSQGFYMAAKGYRRYNTLATAINAVDVAAGMLLYKKFHPLMLQVFAEFSYPQQYQLEDLLKKTGALIVSAPIIDEKIRLIKPSVYYKFQDEDIEALDPMQKQMIRMGPENTRIIQRKVRQLLAALVN